MKFLRFFLLFISLSSCNKNVQNVWMGVHPIWNFLNENECYVANDRCIITKFGFGKMRFKNVEGKEQVEMLKILDDKICKIDGNYVELTADYVFITPKKYGVVVKGSEFKSILNKIKYKFNTKYQFNTDEYGLTDQFLNEFVKLDKEHAKESIFIISQGIEGLLSISQTLKKAFEEKKSKKEIVDYHFLCSVDAVRLYNQKIKEGKSVFLFLHTAG